VAAAAYQIEGAWNEDGKWLSVWDMMTRQKGRIWEDQTGNVACDHYHRYKEDVGLLAEIGLQAYRLSVSWPRVLPRDVRAVNEPGLAFYDRLIDELLAHNIQPWVTLFHWDFPYDFFLRGGWLNPDSSRWFSDYAVIVVDRLSDRVAHSITLNEPQCFIGLGHLGGGASTCTGPPVGHGGGAAGGASQPGGPRSGRTDHPGPGPQDPRHRMGAGRTWQVPRHFVGGGY
jgi:beta-glucosidase